MKRETFLKIFDKNADMSDVDIDSDSDHPTTTMLLRLLNATDGDIEAAAAAVPSDEEIDTAFHHTTHAVDTDSIDSARDELNALLG